jgi:predicted GH43/DUF377 family glycosyl hydrolase
MISFKKSLFCNILPFFLFLNCSLFSLIDLEEHYDDCVLETKRIILKDYEHAFNPSIIRWNGQLVMSFRIIPNPLLTFNSQIGIVFLDDNFEPQSPPQLIDTQNKNSFVPSRAEDARLINIGDKLYIIYSDNKDDYISRGGFRVYVSELQNSGGVLKPCHTDCLKDFEGASPYLREKNWVPFVYSGELMLAYSLEPHKIFHYIPQSEKCETIALSSKFIKWEYGELRGGTPAILDGENYLSFFHSSIDMLTAHSNNRKISHYFMGAYTFSATPPFELTSASKKPIIGKGFYKGEYYKPYWKSVRCIFPCGLLIEEPYIYVSYGRQDHEIWIVKMDKQLLLDSLKGIEK